MNVIGHQEIDGVPYINGKRAIHDPPEQADRATLLGGTFSEWRCPECNARLGGGTSICLNACHLSAASARRFQALMAETTARVNRDRHREQMVKDGKIIDAIGDLTREEQ